MVRLNAQEKGNQTAASHAHAHTHIHPLTLCTINQSTVWFHYFRPNCVRRVSTYSGGDGGVRAAERNRRWEQPRGRGAEAMSKLFIHRLLKKLSIPHRCISSSTGLRPRLHWENNPQPPSQARNTPHRQHVHRLSAPRARWDCVFSNLAREGKNHTNITGCLFYLVK